VTARSTATVVLRPAPNTPIVAVVDCEADEQVIGGGMRAAASDPADESDFHLQESGPTPTGWLARASAISAFRPGSTLTLTATAFCLAP